MVKSPATLLSITALLCSTLGASATVRTDYSFDTNDSFQGTRHTKKLRRARRTKLTNTVADSHVTNVNVKHAASKEAAVLAKEDKIIWNRLLDEEMSMNTRAPSFAPVASPVASPVAPPPTGGENGGGVCPVRVSLLYGFVVVVASPMYVSTSHTLLFTTTTTTTNNHNNNRSKSTASRSTAVPRVPALTLLPVARPATLALSKSNIVTP